MGHDRPASRPFIPAEAEELCRPWKGSKEETGKGPRSLAAGEHVAAWREQAADSGEGPPTGGSRAGTQAGGRKDPSYFQDSWGCLSIIRLLKIELPF